MTFVNRIIVSLGGLFLPASSSPIPGQPSGSQRTTGGHPLGSSNDATREIGKMTAPDSKSRPDRGLGRTYPAGSLCYRRSSKATWICSGSGKRTRGCLTGIRVHDHWPIHHRSRRLVSYSSYGRGTAPRLEIPPPDLSFDNGSRDHSLENRGVRLLPLTGNRGFAAAVNLGVLQARGELVALLNNDAVASPEWIEQLMSGIGASPDVGMCASKILFHGSDVIDKAGHLIFPDGQNRGRGTGERDRGQYDVTQEVLAADGCAALYRKEVLKQAGGFDERFFAYAEDADLGLRARWLGWRCLYVPEAVVHHHHSSTLGPYSPRKIYWVERNRLWLALKNFPLPLLLLNPVFSGYRLVWNLSAALLRRGAAGNFRPAETPFGSCCGSRSGPTGTPWPEPARCSAPAAGSGPPAGSATWSSTATSSASASPPTASPSRMRAAEERPRRGPPAGELRLAVEAAFNSPKGP